MPQIESKLNPRSEEFQHNRDAMQRIVDDLREKVAAIAEGGGQAARGTWRAASCCRASACRCCWTRARPSWNSRNWLPTAYREKDRDLKMPRPRPASSPASAAWPGSVIVCNDATVKGGTYYPMTVKKHLRAQEIAEEPPALHLPGRQRRRQPAQPG
jgi:3-methylcrotonyl-CoA carboxylase beta subunit